MEEVVTTETVSEQVETPVEATTTTEEVKPEVKPETPEQTEEKQKNNGVQKRFSELTAARRAAEQYAQRLEEQNQRMMQLLERVAPQNQKQTDTDAPPKSEEFDDYNEFLRASARFEVRQEMKAEQNRRAQEEQQRRAKDAERSNIEKATKVHEKGREKHPDFDDVIESALHSGLMTPSMVVAAVDSDIAPDLVYYLAKNEGEARRIASLSPASQAREIGKLEVKLSVPKIPETTKAPPPIKPVGGSGSVEKDPEKMSTEEWIKWRNEQTKR